jgi:hypothetical protein
MSKKLKNCPTTFYANCASAPSKCGQCVAGTGHTKLYYVPVISGFDDHPASDWQKDKQKRRKQQTQAKQTEQRVADEIVRHTQRSGAANHDGDLALGSYNHRLEVKRRGLRQSWNLTSTEYDYGRGQGIDVWAIEIQRSDLMNNPPQTIYCCTPEFFAYLLSCSQALEAKANDDYGTEQT